MIANDPRALERVDALHSALTNLVLAGGDLSRIAEEVSGVLGVDVLVTSTDGRELAAAVAATTRETLTRREWFDATGRFQVERISPGGVPLEPQGAGEIVMINVAAAGSDLARLICIRGDRGFDQADLTAIERAGAVTALLITRQQAVTAVENKYRGDFLRDVFLRRAGDDDYVISHVRGFGWDLTRPVVVVCAQLDRDPDEGDVGETDRRRLQERFSAAWRLVTGAIDKSIPSVDFSSEVVTLLPAGVDPRVTVDQVVSRVAGDRGGGRKPFSVGVSRVAPDLSRLPDAYAQARRALEVGRRIHGSRSTTTFDQLGLHRLLALVPDQRELQVFAADVLGDLAASTADAADLRVTLQVLLDTNFNVAEAARLQFFHYNTMRYRVGKLERMLGPLSTDPHLRLDVAVALKVLEIVG